MIWAIVDSAEGSVGVQHHGINVRRGYPLLPTVDPTQHTGDTRASKRLVGVLPFGHHGAVRPTQRRDVSVGISGMNQIDIMGPRENRRRGRSGIQQVRLRGEIRRVAIDAGPKRNVQRVGLGEHRRRVVPQGKRG